MHNSFHSSSKNNHEFHSANNKGSNLPDYFLYFGYKVNYDIDLWTGSPVRR